MSEKTPIELLRMRDLALLMRNGIADDVVDLLEDTIWGTPGGTRYQHLNTRQKIQDVKEPYFLELRKGERLLGALCMAHRETTFLGGGHHAFYIRYLSLMESIQRKVRTNNAGPTSGMRGNSLLKRVTYELFHDPKILLEQVQAKSAVFYAYVELENERSQEMTRNMGFAPIGQFSTIIFSRFFPKKHPNARRLRQDERPQMEEKLRIAYQNHALFSTQSLFYKDKYWVLEENGKIVAALQASPVHWVITGMPGFSGKFIMNVLPHLPLIKRMFNPKKYQFVVVDGIYCAPGKEKALHQLMTHAMVENEVYSALLWLDRLDPMFAGLKRFGKLGLFNRINGDSPATIIARFHGLTEAEEQRIRNQPRYISAFDST